MKPFYLLPVVILVAAACGSTKPAGDLKQDRAIEVGYGTAVQRNVTSSVSVVDVAEKGKVNTYRDIYEMIRGKCPGVQVLGNRILIRGVNSINSSTDPLFVVDGSPVNSIDNINPNDVKSISVLKDSAAAIYGSRGANGVILITLK